MTQFGFYCLMIIGVLFLWLVQGFFYFKAFRWVNPASSLTTQKLFWMVFVGLFVPNIVIGVPIFLFLDKVSNREISLALIGLFSLVANFLILIKIGKLSLIKSIGTFVLFGLLSWILFQSVCFFYKPYSIPSGAMEDTILIGDDLLADNFYYGHSFFNKTKRYFQSHVPQRGDLVIFVYPQDHSKKFIKRCMGVPGDVIQMKNQVFYVNGQKQNESYVKHLFSLKEAIREEGVRSLKVSFGPVTVQSGYYWMMGDNRDNSFDSRYWGQLDEKLILGKAIGIYWREKDRKILMEPLH